VLLADEWANRDHAFKSGFCGRSGVLQSGRFAPRLRTAESRKEQGPVAGIVDDRKDQSVIRRKVVKGVKAKDKGAKLGKGEQTLQTRARVLQAALDLFNERGAAPVTTHHIAEKAGISPGNLYYHFTNKEEIIRELFRRIDVYDEKYWRQKGPMNPEGSFLKFLDFFFGSVWKYRFFFREFSQLINGDDALKRAWQRAFRDLLAEMRTAARFWTEAEMMWEFKSEEAVDAFIENCWIILNFGASFLDAKDGKSGKKSSQQIAKLLYYFLYPYHTPKGQAELDRYLHALLKKTHL
jgi:AcrR family transcriptional regulator